MKKITLLLCTLLSFFTIAFANNVTVTGVSYNGSTHRVAFTLSWENSWDLTGGAPPGNHDAVWVFVKGLTGTDAWTHLPLSTNAADHTIGSSLAPAQPTAMKTTGILIKRGTPGFGNINNNNTVSLQLNTTAGISAIQVFAIEMVYITEGAFEVGNDPFAANFDALKAYTINSDVIPATVLFYNPTDIVAEFPKGFRAFYCMKYEISQGQYTDFLNSLTRAQQITHVASDISGTTVTNQYVMTNQPTLTEFNHIVCGATLPATGSITFSCAVPEKACNFLTYSDLAGYLDWAGLRLITELEFEKICRGFDAREDDQFIFGGSDITSNVVGVDVVDADLPSETSRNADPTVNTVGEGHVSINGRLMRCGFSGNKANTRKLSGATYFGVMEMAGNVGEIIMMISNNTYTGENGNGDVSDVPAFWPDYTTAPGMAIRGGHYKTGASSSHLFIRTRRHSLGGWSLANAARYYLSGGRGALSL